MNYALYSFFLNLLCQDDKTRCFPDIERNKKHSPILRSCNTVRIICNYFSLLCCTESKKLAPYFSLPKPFHQFFFLHGPSLGKIMKESKC